MKIHYFQRYHSKENVATANTMLLLSRLYSYSPEKFFNMLKSEFFFDGFNPEITITLQKKNKMSIPDATISQESFKIVVETKMSDWFYSDQLLRHLESFSDEKHKVLLTIAPEPMDKEKRLAFEKTLAEYNSKQDTNILHVNTTFEQLADAFNNAIDEHDYEMQDVLKDYLSYCFEDGLINVSDSWKWMRVELANVTFDFNMKENVYYHAIDAGFRAHDYIGLYKDKSVRAIGKINTIVTTTQKEDGTLLFNAEQGEITEDIKRKIRLAIEDGKQYGYKLDNIRYFFVDQFIETDFRKITPRAPMGARNFDLTQLLNTDNLTSVEDIAKQLTTLNWQ